MRIIRKLVVTAIVTVCGSIFAGFVPGCIFGGEDRPVVIKATDKVPDTIVTPVLETPIAPHTNVIWCGTAQLAWNEMADLAGGQVRFVEPAPPIAAMLDRREVGSADFDPDSEVALAGYYSDGICDQVTKLMREKFPKIPPPQLPPPEPLAEGQLLSYAFLFKTLEFSIPFQKSDEPIKFDGRKVSAFGLNGEKGTRAIADQIVVLDYRNPDDFVIELRTKSPGDRLILAKLSPGPTLAQTLAQVHEHIAASRPVPAAEDDLVKVPKMSFDISHRFGELIGRELVSTTPRMAAQTKILEARQDIQFRMDEKGVRVESFSFFEAEALGDPPRPLVFDKPFLILMQRSDRSQPYFAAWIGNSRLLVGD